MRVRYGLIDKLISKLTSENPELHRAPVRIEKIIRKLGIELDERDFEYAMSGAAIIDAGRKIISINKKESDVRKRFTAAHELGHILLHYDQELNVDLKPIRLNRDLNSATGESWREIEANYFAASLLMPTDLLAKHHEKLVNAHEDDDEVLTALARKFEVSIQAMSIRLAKLELLSM